MSRVLSFPRRSPVPSGAAAGPGGAPAAAQRRGRPTWTREAPTAGWPAAEDEEVQRYQSGGDRPGERGAALISLSPPRGEDQVGWEGLRSGSAIQCGPSTRPEVLRRLPERRAGWW